MRLWKAQSLQSIRVEDTRRASIHGECRMGTGSYFKGLSECEGKMYEDICIYPTRLAARPE